jgi:VIT1/CCC1 family predicted Fe2+/Mn2+ transporter
LTLAVKTDTAALELKLNWLRAAVLGANDGIVSVAGVVIGVASAGAQRETILLAGVAALVAGAVSMAGGEYTSVSAQRDTELSHGKDPNKSAAHPWQAAWSSFVAFTLGALLPLFAMIGPWEQQRILVTSAAVVVALAATGWWAAFVGRSSITRGILRNVLVSLATVTISWGIGQLLGVTVL